jgi:hypothetical protein
MITRVQGEKERSSEDSFPGGEIMNTAYLSWFRLLSIYSALCGTVFFLLPHRSNELFGINYITSLHAEDWTRLFGLSLFPLAYLLNAAHGSKSEELRRIVARGVLFFTVPCAAIMAYWQVIPDGRWNRLDIGNVVILGVLSSGLLAESAVGRRKR